MSALETLGLAPFRPRPPWWGPDLQTLRNFIVALPAELPGKRLWIDAGDGSGDRLAALLNEPPCTVQKRSTVVLVHGLSGSEASRYMAPSARYFLDRGHAVLRLNLRGAGPSRASCHDHYHAGRSGDLAAVVRALPDALAARGVVLIGFSLGGSLALKYAAECGRNGPLAAVVSVSAPIDLADASLNMLRRRNALYHRRLLADFKRERASMCNTYSADELAVLASSRNFLDLDDRFVAPRFGFANAYDYYERCAAGQFLGAVRTPALLIHALDDPIVPASAYQDQCWRDNCRLYPLLPEQGGHVGFHGAEGQPWYLGSVSRFLAKMGAD